MNAIPQLLLIDGSSYLYRAYYAMPNLRATINKPDSAPTGAIRGMINMLQSIRKDFPCTLAACVFDAKGPTFRNALYTDYKANRAPMPDDLRTQLAPIYEVIRLLGWQILEVEGVEADDVIATVAKTAASQGLDVLISSGDKDLAQLVNEKITVIDTMSGKKRDQVGVNAEFGVPAHLMIDYQILVGDKVDNVPGVEKVGPVTAVKLLKEYGNLNNLVAQAEHLKGAIGVNLRKALLWLPTARALITMKTDCDLSAFITSWPQLDSLLFQEPDTIKLEDFYQTYGFKSLLKNQKNLSEFKKEISKDNSQVSLFTENELDSLASSSSLTISHDFQTIDTWDKLEHWITTILEAPLVAIDTETNGLNSIQSRLVGISFCMEIGKAAYLPLAHTDSPSAIQLPIDEALAKLKRWLENANYAKLGHHCKYDRHIFANHGIEVKGYTHDTMLQSYVLEAHRRHNLSSLGERFLGRCGTSYEDLCGKGAHQISFAKVAIEKAAHYSCEDAEMTFSLHQILYQKLQTSTHLLLVYELEIACSEVLFHIERNGVLIDSNSLKLQSRELQERIINLEEKAYALAGETFNLNSPKQLGELFFQRLGFPIIKKTATGAPSTDEEVLEKLALDYPLPATILTHRGLAKLKNTYTDKLPALVDQNSHRLHTHYAQAVAVTGRLSSNDPNLQNIPIKTAEGRKIREAFIAPPHHQIASADYSQIELRIMAHLSDDPELLKAFCSGQDVHRSTAAEILGISPEEVNSEQRRHAKVINFGLIYGMSAYGLAKTLGITNDAAKNYIERYFDRYPGVKAYMNATRQKAKSLGYVETVMGRRLYLAEINSPNGPRRAAAERAAINAPMQGTAADLIKLSMIAVQKSLKTHELKSKIIMQVHDELVFEVPDEEINWIKENIPVLMTEVAQLKVPLLVELGMGGNWDEAH